MAENCHMIPRSYHAYQALLPDLVDGAALCISAFQRSSDTTIGIPEADFGPVNTSLIGD
jgi:hypothetical protein